MHCAVTVGGRLQQLHSQPVLGLTTHFKGLPDHIAISRCSTQTAGKYLQLLGVNCHC